MAVQQVFGNPDQVTTLGLQLVLQAEQFLSSLGGLAQSLHPQTIAPVFPTPTNAPLPLTAPHPVYQPVTWSTPITPDPFSGSLDISGLLPAPFSVAAPDLSFGTAPAVFSDVEPAAPPIDLNLVFPELTLQLPAPPSLMSLSTVTFAGVNIPSIDVTVPALLAVAPNVITYSEQLYASPELTLLKSTLSDRIQNGGTGLPPAIEQALWDRAREREFRTQADALADLDRMETMGFAFPPGVYLDARIKIQTETQNTTAGLSREVMIKQAELELQNILKALEEVNALEGKLIDYTNQVNQRAFESAKYVTEAGIQIYNSQVQAYTAKLDAYKTRASIYEAQIRAALAEVDVYKARIEGEQVKAEINKTLVDQYHTIAEIELSKIEVYKAELGAVQTRAEIEKTKIEVFGEQIKAFVGRINAYTANVEGYKASVQAQATKQDAFKSRVDAYAAQVNAGVQVARVRVEEFQGRIAAKNTEWEGYKASVQGMASQAQAITSYNTTLVEGYRADISGLAAYNDTVTKQWQVALDQAERVTEIGVKAAEANAQLYATTRSLALDAAKVGAQVAAQLGASALNAVHFSNSSSWSTGESLSVSQSNSSSTSSSTNENHNYSV